MHWEPLFGCASRVLCLGAHADDIEIGCGGALLRLADECPGLRVTWVILSATEERASEARASAARFLARAGEHEVRVLDFRDGFMPYQGADVKGAFERLKEELSPDLIFTHTREDAHQDHRLVAELTWNTWRSQPILEYEVPKYEGDLGKPNLFVSLSEEQCRRKVELLLEGYPSQRERRWFTPDTFQAILRLRGVEAAVPYAEAFHCRKLVV